MRPLILLRALLATKLGACAFCIRLSLALSALSWIAFVGLRLWLPGSAASRLALVPALCFTTLFVSHLVAYALRVTHAYRTAARATPAPGVELAATRRRFIVAAASTIGLALLPAALAAAVSRSIGASGACLPPKDCTTACCCHQCKTRLKQCDPYYWSCQAYCKSQCCKNCGF